MIGLEEPQRERAAGGTGADGGNAGDVATTPANDGALADAGPLAPYDTTFGAGGIVALPPDASAIAPVGDAIYFVNGTTSAAGGVVLHRLDDDGGAEPDVLLAPLATGGQDFPVYIMSANGTVFIGGPEVLAPSDSATLLQTVPESALPGDGGNLRGVGAACNGHSPVAGVTSVGSGNNLSFAALLPGCLDSQQTPTPTLVGDNAGTIAAVGITPVGQLKGLATSGLNIYTTIATVDGGAELDTWNVDFSNRTVSPDVVSQTELVGDVTGAVVAESDDGGASVLAATSTTMELFAATIATTASTGATLSPQASAFDLLINDVSHASHRYYVGGCVGARTAQVPWLAVLDPSGSLVPAVGNSGVITFPELAGGCITNVRSDAKERVLLLVTMTSKAPLIVRLNKP